MLRSPELLASLNAYLDDALARLGPQTLRQLLETVNPDSSARAKRGRGGRAATERGAPERPAAMPVDVEPTQRPRRGAAARRATAAVLDAGRDVGTALRQRRRGLEGGGNGRGGNGRGGGDGRGVDDVETMNLIWLPLFTLVRLA